MFSTFTRSVKEAVCENPSVLAISAFFCGAIAFSRLNGKPGYSKLLDGRLAVWGLSKLNEPFDTISWLSIFQGARRTFVGAGNKCNWSQGKPLPGSRQSK